VREHRHRDGLHVVGRDVVACRDHRVPLRHRQQHLHRPGAHAPRDGRVGPGRGREVEHVVLDRRRDVERCDLGAGRDDHLGCRHRCQVAQPDEPALAPEEPALAVPVGHAEVDAHREAVVLPRDEREGATLAVGVLRGEHQEGVG